MEFTSPINPKNIWTLCFKDRNEMNRIFYEDRPIDQETRLFGLTEYVSQTIYVDKDLDGFLLGKTLRHELTHVYLWETGQQEISKNEEEICDFMGVAGPIICKCADNLILRLREGLYKNGEL